MFLSISQITDIKNIVRIFYIDSGQIHLHSVGNKKMAGTKTMKQMVKKKYTYIIYSYSDYKSDSVKTESDPSSPF